MNPRKRFPDFSRPPSHPLPDFTRRPPNDRQPNRPLIVRSILPEAQRLFRPPPQPQRVSATQEWTGDGGSQLAARPRELLSRSQSVPTFGSGRPPITKPHPSLASSPSSSFTDSFPATAGSSTAPWTVSSYDTSSSRSSSPSLERSIGTQYPSPEPPPPARRSMGTQYSTPSQSMYNKSNRSSSTPSLYQSLSSPMSSRPASRSLSGSISSVSSQSIGQPSASSWNSLPSPMRGTPSPPPAGRSLSGSISSASSGRSLPSPMRGTPSPPESSIESRQYWQPTPLTYDPELPEFRGHDQRPVTSRVTQIPGDPRLSGWRGWKGWDRVGKMTRGRSDKYDLQRPKNLTPDGTDDLWTDPSFERINKWEASGSRAYKLPQDAEQFVYREPDPEIFRQMPYPMPKNEYKRKFGKNKGLTTAAKKLLSGRRKKRRDSGADADQTAEEIPMSGQPKQIQDEEEEEEVNDMFENFDQ
ncbi:uncharacterized protein LOC128955235 [Oppia nitens]|uniref:uncharacterized protein LOC128955235 n=1 Tax=Oppia nitens TaxID=1686743 RepID=UPI0023DB343C|nr:uncharacterized protein LOC128955235 [Oppia nitens]